MNHTIYLGLGSNLGERRKFLGAAIETLQPKVQPMRISALYETAPWGFEQQGDFLNVVVEAQTELSPQALLEHLKAVENKVGREATFKNGPRQIDIDILFYDDLVLEEEGLVVPHPRVHARSFMLAPLVELHPEFVHPVFGKNVSELLALAGNAGVKEKIPGIWILKPLPINNRLFEWGSRTHIMGIINITPDSFSGDGLSLEQSPVSAAMRQARHFADNGADILDVGGESTRPGAEPVSAEEEQARVLPIIEALAQEFELPISIDTYRASTAVAALDAGAHMVNDVWALRADPELAPLVAQRGVPIILMHNRSKPANAEIQKNLGGRYIGVEYDDLLADIRSELLDSVSLAQRAGISEEAIILDPGIGFGKTVEQNLELLDRTGEIRDLGFPLLIGPSRKSFIGYTLDLPADQRVEGTAAAVAIAIARGADIVRVHDVEAMARVVKMTDALVRRKPSKALSP